MTSCTPPAFTARLACGQTLTRALAAGDEIFCAGGMLQLATSALAGVDALADQRLWLQAGQGWRAPCALWIQVTALGTQADLRWSPAFTPVEPPRRRDWSTRVAALFKRWHAART